VAEIAYVVQCTFTGPDADTVAAEWLAWLRGEHIADVIAGGATSGTIIQLDPVADSPGATYQIHYRFPDRETFRNYEANHAPRLRDEGLQRFPLDRGLTYARTVGEVQFTG